MSEKSLAVWGGATFDLAPQGTTQVPAELAGALVEEDHAGYEDDGSSYPTVKIRQKDAFDGKKMIAGAGGFTVYDSSLKDQPPDVSGDDGLILTIIADRNERVYFENLTDKKPSCVSLDGLAGRGSPGGDCSVCDLGRITDGHRGKCAAQKNLIVYDHNGQSLYSLRLGPSGLKPLRNLKLWLSRAKPKAIPPVAVILKVTTMRVAEPAPHFVPVFDFVDYVPVEMLKQFREARKSIPTPAHAPADNGTGDDDLPY